MGQKYTKGFTLIELSIVLIIIGLVIGGVLVGQDLIRASEIRATVAQIEKYNTAANTFRGKYNALPGDITPASAAQFGFYSGLSGGQYYGDGDGIIESGYVCGMALAYGEALVFWAHLSQAGLIDGSFTSATFYPNDGENNTPNPWTYLPAAKLGNNNYFMISCSGGSNYFGIFGAGNSLSFVYNANPSVINKGGNLTPTQAYAIDQKTDDGLPQSGKIMAINQCSLRIANCLTTMPEVGDWVQFPPTDLATVGCATGTSPDQTYNVSGTSGSTMSCALRIQADF